MIVGRTTAAGRVGVDMRECEMSARPPVGRMRNVGLDLVEGGRMSGPHGLTKKGGTKACWRMRNHGLVGGSQNSAACMMLAVLGRCKARTVPYLSSRSFGSTDAASPQTCSQHPPLRPQQSRQNGVTTVTTDRRGSSGVPGACHCSPRRRGPTQAALPTDRPIHHRCSRGWTSFRGPPNV